MEARFTVPGEPRGKGRPRFSNGHAYTDSDTRAYEEKLTVYYRRAYGSFRFPDNGFVQVAVTAFLLIPKSRTKATQAAMARREILPSRKPDADNVLKIVLDALNGVAYKDDSRVYKVSCVKYYSTEPRLEIVIKEAGT